MAKKDKKSKKNGKAVAKKSDYGDLTFHLARFIAADPSAHEQGALR